MNQFVANTGAMNGWQGIVDGVSGEVSSFKNSFSGPSDLSASHGAIGFPMQNAFSGAQSSRDGALGATQAAASRMAELLGQASKAYERGDLAAAGQLKAQADQMEGAAASPASAAGGANSASTGSGAGGAGQMLGQMGQMGGQLAQSITQPLQGITQALGQIPQQVMQGVQGIVEAATQAGGSGADAATMAAHTGGDTGTGWAEHAVKAGDIQGPDHGSPDGPGDPHDTDHGGKDDPDHDREHSKHAGDTEQVGNGAAAGMGPDEGFGVGVSPAQIRNIKQ